MPDFTLYNAADFHDFTPEDIQSEFAEMLGRPQVVMPEDTGDATYYSREDIFAACLGVAHGKDEAARLAFGGTSTSPRLVFAKLTPSDVCLLNTDEHPRSLTYHLHAGGERLGWVMHKAPYDHLTAHTLLESQVALFDFVGSYHVAEYAYVSGGEAASPGWDSYDSPLADGSYVLLEQTGTLY